MATAEQRNHAKSFLTKAEQYLASAEDNLEVGRYTPAAGDAIHAGISAKDAILTALTGATTKGRDHASAAKELGRALAKRTDPHPSQLGAPVVGRAARVTDETRPSPAWLPETPGSCYASSATSRRTRVSTATACSVASQGVSSSSQWDRPPTVRVNSIAERVTLLR